MTLDLATMAASADGSSAGAPAAAGQSVPGTPWGGAEDVEVVAIVVVHDGARWLSRALSSLASSERRPDRVVAVDAGSTDRSPVLLDTAAGPAGGAVLDAVVAGGRTDGLGTSVARGLRAADELPARPPPTGTAPGPPRRQWVWLLHDDCAPAPDALEVLLSAVAAAPTIAVAGCKQRGWDEPDTLVEVGVTVSHGGRRITDLADGELDQGQHDDRGDVLAVSTAGMLVRRDVWDAVGGIDPALPLVGDDIDLCVRVRRAGHRVAVVPDAVVRHAAALTRGQRAPDALRGRLGRRLLGRPGPEDLPLTGRRRALHLRLVHCQLLAVLPLLLWVVAVAPVRAVGQLVRGRPALAVVEVLAVLGLLLTPWRVVAARWRARRGRVVGPAAVRTMLPTRRRLLRDHVDAWRQRRAARRARPDGAEDERDLLGALESGPVDDTTVDMVLGAPRPLRRLVVHPLTYLVPLLVVLGLALRLGGERVRVAGAAYAVDGLSAADLLARAQTGWRDVGTGVAAVADPAVWVWGLLTSLTSLVATGSPTGSSLGTTHAAVTVAAPAAALLVAYPALRRLSTSTAGAVSLSVTWALLPWTGLLGPVTPGTLLAHVLLPGLGAALFGCLGHRAVRSAGAAALLCTVVVALLPAAWPVLVVAAAVVGVLAGASSSASLRAALPMLAVGAPVLVWASWVEAALTRPELLLLGPDLADPASPVLRTALGDVDRTAVAGLDPRLVLLSALTVVVAGVVVLCAVSLSGRRQVAAWSAAAVGLSAVAVGWAAVRTQVSVTGSPGAGPWSLLWLPVLAVVALLVRRVVAGRGRGPRRHRALVRLTVVLSALVPGLVLLTVAAVPSLVTEPEPTRGLPLAAAVDARSPQQTRTLVLDVTAAPGGGGPGVTWWVGRGEPGLGQDSVDALLHRRGDDGPSADARLARLVGGLLGRPATTPEALTASPGAPAAPDLAAADVVPQLAAAGIGWVVVDLERGADPALAAVVDEALATRPGMVATAAAGPRTSWRVDPGPDAPAPARARVVAPDGAAGDPLDVRAPVALQEGTPGRRLVLAEAAQPGWSATLDGVELLPASTGGWGQAFLLPAGAGTLVVEPPGAAPVVGGVAAVTLLLLAGAVLWPWQGRRRMVLRPVPAAVATGSSLRSGLGGAARTGVGATAALALLVGGFAGAGGVTGLPAASPAEVTPRPRGTTPVALASPAQQVSCPGPTGGLVPEGGSGTDADPGTTGVRSVEDLATVPSRGIPVPPEARRGLQLTVATGGDLRGAALTGCARSAVTSWVMLSGTGVGERPTVVLDNPADTSALVDVRALTPDGPAEATAGSGLLVPAGEKVVAAVDALVLDAPAVLVEVTARQGSVAVTGVGTALEGLVPQGRTEVAAATEAATEVVVPAVEVPGDAPGAAHLRIGSVAEEPGVATVTVLGPDGEVELGDEGVVVLPGRSVVDVPLDLPPGTYGLLIEADVPMVAAARSVGGRAGEPAEGTAGVPVDRSWVSAEPAAGGWRDGFAVAWPTAPGVDRPQVDLGLLGTEVPETDGATAEVALVDEDGQRLAGADVGLALDQPARLDLTALLPEDPERRPVAVVVDVPDGAAVHAALQLRVEDPEGPLRAAALVAAPPASADVAALRRR